MRAGSHFTATIVLLALSVAIGPLTQSPRTPADVERAKQLWEEAIAAKGGRDRLYAVRNLAISSYAHCPTDELGLFRRRTMRRAEFLVFPDKLWRWDYSEAQKPPYIEIELFDGRADHRSSTRRPADVTVTHRGSDDSEGRWRPLALERDQLFYLMETPWLKPSPLYVTSDHVYGRAVDVVHTEVDGGQVDFALDRTTHLPVRVRWGRSGETFLRDYREYGGVKMPSIVGPYWICYTHVNYEFNVDYDPNVFDSPPSIATGPEPWRAEPKK